MSRFVLYSIFITWLGAVSLVWGQSPAPSVTPVTTGTSPNPGRPASPTPSPVPTASPTPTREELLGSLTPADVDAALGLVRKNFANSDAVTDAEINRATLQGLVVRLNRGLSIFPGKPAIQPETIPALYAEVLDEHIGYIRAGGINTANVQALDKRLADFAAKKVNALLIDLRASDSGDFVSAADFAKRLVPKSAGLFSLRKPDKQEHPFVSDRDPS